MPLELIEVNSHTGSCFRITELDLIVRMTTRYGNKPSVLKAAQLAFHAVSPTNMVEVPHGWLRWPRGDDDKVELWKGHRP